MIPKSDHDLIMEIHTTLLGTEGQGGLCRSHECLKKDFYHFRLWAIIVSVAVLGGGGIGAWKAVDVLARLVR